MTTTQAIAPNPFALMMEPEVVFAAMASSDRLARLKSRICRPLDNPLTAPDGDDAAVVDQSVDAKVDRADPAR